MMLYVYREEWGRGGSGHCTIYPKADTVIIFIILIPVSSTLLCSLEKVAVFHLFSSLLFHSSGFWVFTIYISVFVAVNSYMLYKSLAWTPVPVATALSDTSYLK